MSNVRFIGLDVHAETIAVAVAEPDGEAAILKDGEDPHEPTVATLKILARLCALVATSSVASRPPDP